MLNPHQILDEIMGMPVSHIWRGYGSALFIEFGQLEIKCNRDGAVGNSSGEITLMIEWSWRVEKKHSILLGSWSTEKKWQRVFEKLLGATVVGVETFGNIPEISISLSNGFRVVSFMTSEGQPSWSLIIRKPYSGTLCVKRGKLIYEPSDS